MSMSVRKKLVRIAVVGQLIALGLTGIPAVASKPPSVITLEMVYEKDSFKGELARSALAGCVGRQKNFSVKLIEPGPDAQRLRDDVILRLVDGSDEVARHVGVIAMCSFVDHVATYAKLHQGASSQLRGHP